LTLSNIFGRNFDKQFIWLIEVYLQICAIIISSINFGFKRLVDENHSAFQKAKIEKCGQFPFLGSFPPLRLHYMARRQHKFLWYIPPFVSRRDSKRTSEKKFFKKYFL